MNINKQFQQLDEWAQSLDTGDSLRKAEIDNIRTNLMSVCNSLRKQIERLKELEKNPQSRGKHGKYNSVDELLHPDTIPAPTITE